MNDAGLLAVIRRMVREERATARAGMAQPLVLPGTVTTGGLPAASVQLRMDGETASHAVFNATGTSLVANQRVYVTLAPPHGAMVTGIITTGPWTDWTPSVASQTGTITTVGAVDAAHRKTDRTVEWRADITITTNGTGAASIQFTLPFAVFTGIHSIGYGRENVNTGKALQVVGATSIATVWFYDNTYPGADGSVLLMSGLYEATT